MTRTARVSAGHDDHLELRAPAARVDAVAVASVWKQNLPGARRTQVDPDRVLGTPESAEYGGAVRAPEQ